MEIKSPIISSQNLWTLYLNIEVLILFELQNKSLKLLKLLKNDKKNRVTQKLSQIKIGFKSIRTESNYSIFVD